MRFRPGRALGLVVLAGWLLSGWLLSGCGGATPPRDAVPTVAEVIDGDTLVIDFGAVSEPVRLIGVDTPETRDPRRGPECYGAEATAFVRALLPPGTALEVTRDAEARDTYGRLLAYVTRAEDGLFVNLALLEGGFAETLSIRPNTTHAAEFSAAARAARAAGRGLWDVCDD